MRNLLAVLAISLHTALPAVSASLSPPMYKTFPVGAVKPSGWALDQAKIQANGLAGSLADWYEFVANSTWTGGTVEYSAMDEAAPYWFNGMVPLAFQLDDSKLKSQVKTFLDYLLAHQGADGWLGPTGPDTPRLIWPRYLALIGLLQYAEADPSETTRIVTAMHRFAGLANGLFRNGTYADPDSSQEAGYQHVRWEELLVSLQWLSDHYPEGKEAELLETMTIARDTGESWKDFYVDGVFPTDIPAVDDLLTHGVNNAEAIKAEALAYRFTQSVSDSESTTKRINLLNQYHGRPSGVYTADEHLAGLHPSQGSETCTVVEMMFSLNLCWQIFGNSSWLDQVEQLAYNALPAALLPDMSVNQIWSKDRVGTDFLWCGHWDSSYSNVFGMESNYPCCTVNFPQGFPKFWANSFVEETSTGSLVNALLGPATFKGKLLDGNAVTVHVGTDYPFGSVLRYSITAARPLTFKVRVPGWALATSTATMNGRTFRLAANSVTSLHFFPIHTGSTSITVNLGMAIRIEKRSFDAVAIHRGALFYALPLTYNETVTEAAIKSEGPLDYLATRPNISAEELSPTDSHAHDHYLTYTTPWNLAIDTSSLRVNKRSEGSLPPSVWSEGHQPVSISATACEIVWPLVSQDPDWPPQSPNRCTGARHNVTLVPFGGTRLRIGELPTMA